MVDSMFFLFSQFTIKLTPLTSAESCSYMVKLVPTWFLLTVTTCFISFQSLVMQYVMQCHDNKQETTCQYVLSEYLCTCNPGKSVQKRPLLSLNTFFKARPVKWAHWVWDGIPFEVIWSPTVVQVGRLNPIGPLSGWHAFPLCPSLTLFISTPSSPKKKHICLAIAYLLLLLPASLWPSGHLSLLKK